MTPRQFEELVCNYFQKQGYKTELTPYSGDFGVDVFAINGYEKIAVQAKMYRGSNRKINKQAIMELHGAKDFFNCTKAVMATDGILLQTATTVAEKIKIEILHIDINQSLPLSKTNIHGKTFDDIWEKYIIPLEGKTLTRKNGDTNQILKADWGGIQRITSNGREGKIKIEIFKYSINKLLTDGFVTRDEINQNYTGRASSGVVLVLSQIPFFQLTETPIGLLYKSI